MCFGSSIYHMHGLGQPQEWKHIRRNFFDKNLETVNTPEPDRKIAEEPQLLRQKNNILISWK